MFVFIGWFKAFSHLFPCSCHFFFSPRWNFSDFSVFTFFFSIWSKRRNEAMRFKKGKRKNWVEIIEVSFELFTFLRSVHSTHSSYLCTNELRERKRKAVKIPLIHEKSTQLQYNFNQSKKKQSQQKEQKKKSDRFK